MSTARKQFTFYESFFKTLAQIKDKSARADAYDTIVKYALLGDEPDLDQLPDTVKIVFEGLRPTLDSARKKSEAGKLGGNQTEPNRHDGEAAGSRIETSDITSEAPEEASKKQARAIRLAHRRREALMQAHWATGVAAGIMAVIAGVCIEKGIALLTVSCTLGAAVFAIAANVLSEWIKV